MKSTRQFLHALSITDEVLQDYRKISMLISCIKCDGKCWKELGLPEDTCQNYLMNTLQGREYRYSDIIKRYERNELTSAIIFGGMEPMLQFPEILGFIKEFRKVSTDDIVIYTGYYKHELGGEIEELSKYNNIVIKFGRYNPNIPPKFDEVLGVTLATGNQYAEKIS